MLCQGLLHKEHRIRVAGLEATLKVITFQHHAMDRALRAVGIVPQALLTLCCSSCSPQPQKQTL